METIQHNLARKWRSRDFDGIVGQPLPIKVLKNSLYLGQFFPVYLFAGQRGCGKTSTARVFAAALNCEQLPAFRKEPKIHAIPCMTCASCIAMQKGAHPDCVEIDAASHTGVDNVRSLIEAASFLPVMGRKKIYLIDEAHMLSKAAFNAFLKIMEEPPEAVVFMLATTDPDKIIDTVRSRCFQLVFKPVDQQVLVDHLVAVCTSEKIAYDQAGLEVIVRASDGSVRDALNMVDQARFASGKITKTAVQAALGSLDDERLLALLATVLIKGPRALLALMQNAALERYAADHIWHMLVNLVRQVLWLKHGVEPRDVTCDKAQLKRIAAACSWRRLNRALDSLYAAEQLFSKTTAQHAVLEMVLLQICTDEDKGGNDSGASGSPSAPAMAQEVEAREAENLEEEDDVVDEEEDGEEVPEDDHASWNGFLMQLSQLDEPLLISVFKQGKVCAHDKIMARLDVEFSKSHLFFSDLMSEARSSWEPLLHKAYGAKVALNPLFTGPALVSVRRQAERKPDVTTAPATAAQKQNYSAKPASVASVNAASIAISQADVTVTPANAVPAKTTTLRPMPVRTVPERTVSAKAVPVNKGVYPVLKQGRPDFRNQQRGGVERQPFAFAREPLLDVSDETVWKKAAMVRRYFPGECREVRENV